MAFYKYLRQKTTYCKITMQSVLKFVWKMIYKFYYSDCSESAVRLCGYVLHNVFKNMKSLPSSLISLI